MRLAVNQKRLGLNENTHGAAFRVFKLRVDVMLHLEDDTVPSPDALKYFDWAVRELLIPDVNRRMAVRSCWRPATESRYVNRPAHCSHDLSARLSAC